MVGMLWQNHNYRDLIAYPKSNTPQSSRCSEVPTQPSLSVIIIVVSSTQLNTLSYRQDYPLQL